MRTAVFVDRDGTLIWGGILWTRQYDPVSETLTVGGNEFWSYFRRRFITDPTSYLSTDQLAIARGIIGWAQGKPNGDIGVQIGAETSGVARDFTSYSFELKPVAEAVEELSQLDDGFDFLIDVAYEGNVPTKKLRLGYPRLGSHGAGSELLFEFPGNAIEPAWNEDGTESANVMYLQGEGGGDAMVRATIASPDMLDAGFPLLDGTMAVKDTSDPAQLEERARAVALARRSAITVPKLRVLANADPKLGTYGPGDDARVRITSARFPDGLDTVRRITQLDITPNEPGQMESVDLTLGAV
jgi:hypothetical protein